MTTAPSRLRVRDDAGRFRPLRWWEKLAAKLLLKVVGHA
jgi:hypothetical protein